MPADPATAVPPATVLAEGFPPGGRSHRRSVVQGIVAATVLAAVFTLVCVQWSFARGRLSQDVTYDDSSYMCDAGRRLIVLYDQGFAAFVTNLCKDPPHALFTDLGAELGFSLFGFHDWVPYVCVNGPVIFLLLLAVAYVGRAISLRARVALMVFALTIPLTVMGLHEYRPDFPGALFTALGIYLVTEAALYRASPWRKRQWVIGGLFFGLALVTKSVFFVHTLTMEALTVAAACGLTWWFADTPDARRGWLRRAAGIAVRVLLPSLLLAAPYYIVNFRETFGYFYDFALGAHSHVSELKGGLGSSVHFYTFGYAGQLMLGGSFFVGLALYAICLGAVVWAKDWKEIFLQGVLLGLAAVSLGSIVINHRENHYFGVPADVFLLFALLRAAAAAWPRLCATPARAAFGLALMAALCIVNLTRLDPAMIWPYATAPVNYVVKRGDSLNQRLLDDMWHEFGLRAAIVPADPPLVFVTRGGFVTAPTFRWLAIKAQRRLNFIDVWTDANLETSRRMLEAATFVIAPEDNATGVYNENASYDLRFEVERLMAAMPGLRLLRRYPSFPGGPAFRLYVNDNRMIAQYGDFGDFRALEGFLPWEGPYPEMKLGQVRWSVGPRSRFTLWADAPGDATLRFSVRADQPVKATLRQGDKPVLSIDAPHVPDFQAFSAPGPVAGR